MKSAVVVLALFFWAGNSLAADCSSPAELKFTCTYYDFFADKYSKIEVDIPAGLECDIAPFSGTIYVPDANKKKTIYSPRVTFKFLTKDIHFAEIEFKETETSAKQVELICADIKFSN